MSKYIDFSNKESYKNIQPLSCSINNRSIKIEENTWACLLTSFTNYCLKKNKDAFSDLKDKPMYGRQQFLYKKEKHSGSYHKLINGSYIRTDYSTLIILKIIINLCNYCSINLDKVKIGYSQTKIAKKKGKEKTESQTVKKVTSIVILAKDKKKEITRKPELKIEKIESEDLLELVTTKNDDDRTEKLKEAEKTIHKDNVDVVSNIDFLLADYYKNIHPISCLIYDETIPIEENTWASLLKSITEYCLKWKRHHFDQIGNKPVYGDKPFLYSKDKHLGSFHKLSNGKFILTSFSSSEIIKIIKSLCTICSIEIKNVLVSYAPGRAQKKKKNNIPSNKIVDDNLQDSQLSKDNRKLHDSLPKKTDRLVKSTKEKDNINTKTKTEKKSLSEHPKKKKSSSLNSAKAQFIDILDPSLTVIKKEALDRTTIKSPKDIDIKTVTRIAEKESTDKKKPHLKMLSDYKIEEELGKLNHLGNKQSEYNTSIIFNVPNDENESFENHERDPITTYIGVDIGTKFTKVFFKIANDTVNYEMPMKHKYADAELFSPTELWIANNQLFFWEQEIPKNTEFSKYDYLKLRFAEDKDYEVLFIIYIVKIIMEAKNYIYHFKNSKSDIKYYSLDFEIAVTYPETLYSNKSNDSYEHFKKVITVVDQIINSFSGKQITLGMIEKFSYNAIYSEKKVRIAIYTEAKSEMISFISSIRDSGQIILIDIGEGTTEISGCWVHTDKKVKVDVWASRVLTRGVLHYKNDPERYKQDLKSQVQVLLQSDKIAHLDEKLEGNFMYANTIFISGGGCTIQDITDFLKVLTIHNKTKRPEIITMDKHGKALSTVEYYHRFLVTMGSIELLENENHYKIQDYHVYRTNNKKSTKKRKGQTQKEKIEEKRRMNEL